MGVLPALQSEVIAFPDGVYWFPTLADVQTELAIAGVVVDAGGPPGAEAMVEPVLLVATKVPTGTDRGRPRRQS